MSVRWAVAQAPDPRAEPAVDDDLGQMENEEAEQGTTGGAQERAQSEMTGTMDLSNGMNSEHQHQALQDQRHHAVMAGCRW